VKQSARSEKAVLLGKNAFSPVKIAFSLGKIDFPYCAMPV
jgi:hypothetical protein